VVGCGNNKVSRDYLTSQPVTTPSPKAAKATAAKLGSQVLRVFTQLSQASEDRAAQSRAETAREAKAAADAKARAEVDRMTAEKKAEDKKARVDEAVEQREHERLMNDLAYRAAATAPNQASTYVNHEGAEVRSWQIKQHSGGIQYMTDVQGMLTSEKLHVSTIAKPDGSFDIHLTDRRDPLNPIQVEKIALSADDYPEVADDLFIAACQEFLTDMLRDLKSSN
jgi:hypothetical protein